MCLNTVRFFFWNFLEFLHSHYSKNVNCRFDIKSAKGFPLVENTILGIKWYELKTMKVCQNKNHANQLLTLS